MKGVKHDEGKPRLLIIGHARSGKDTLAELFNEEYGYNFRSSSVAASEIFIYDKLSLKYGYKNPLECFKDRVNHRDEWHNLICEYNRDDKARLAKDILKTSDGYCGMRCAEEIAECRKQALFDLIIWVDAEGRIPNEPSSSFNIDKINADIVIENKTGLIAFETKARHLANIIFNVSKR